MSRIVHSWVLARSDRARSWSVYRQAIDADLDDSQGGTTQEGIHLGAMAGSIDAILRCYVGVATREGALWFNPSLPPDLEGTRFELAYRGHQVRVEAAPDRLRVALAPGPAPPVRIGVVRTLTTMGAGESRDFPIPGDR